MTRGVRVEEDPETTALLDAIADQLGFGRAYARTYADSHGLTVVVDGVRRRKGENGSMATANIEAPAVMTGPHGGYLSPLGEEIVWEVITPDRAKALLGSSKGNRNLRSREVAKYQRDMAAGRWHSSTPIRLYADGTLHEGHHRCEACIRSDTPFATWVIYDSQPESHAVIDSGVKRTQGDFLHWRGEENVAALAAAIAFLARWDKGQLSGGDNVEISNQEAWEYLENHPDIRNALRAAAPVYKETGLLLRVGAAFYYRASQIDADAADVLMERLRTGALMAPGDPVLALRNWLMKGSDQAKSPKTRLAVICKAWNHSMQGKRIRLMHWREDEGFPELVGRNGKVWPFPNTTKGTPS